MKRMSLLTQKFISDNVKNNAASSSYPQRIVNPKTTPTKNVVIETQSKSSSCYSCFNTNDSDKLFT